MLNIHSFISEYLICLACFIVDIGIYMYTVMSCVVSAKSESAFYPFFEYIYYRLWCLPKEKLKLYGNFGFDPEINCNKNE